MFYHGDIVCSRTVRNGKVGIAVGSVYQAENCEAAIIFDQGAGNTSGKVRHYRPSHYKLIDHIPQPHLHIAAEPAQDELDLNGFIDGVDTVDDGYATDNLSDGFEECAPDSFDAPEAA